MDARCRCFQPYEATGNLSGLCFGMLILEVRYGLHFLHRVILRIGGLAARDESGCQRTRASHMLDQLVWVPQPMESRRRMAGTASVTARPRAFAEINHLPQDRTGPKHARWLQLLKLATELITEQDWGSDRKRPLGSSYLTKPGLGGASDFNARSFGTIPFVHG